MVRLTGSNWCFSIKCPPHYSTRLTLLFLRVRHTMGMNHDFNRAWGCEVLILPLASPRWGTKGVVVPGWGTRAGACRVRCSARQTNVVTISRTTGDQFMLHIVAWSVETATWASWGGTNTLLSHSAYSSRVGRS